MAITASRPPELAIRPLTPEDRAEYLRAFEQLSPESRRMRFFLPKKRLTDADLHFFLDVDHHRHEALAASVDGRAVGVARYICDNDDPTLADIAVTVVDRWQHRGIGRALAVAIADRAREEGVTRLRAHVLSANRPALDLVAATARRPRRRNVDHGVIELELSLSSAV